MKKEITLIVKITASVAEKYANEFQYKHIREGYRNSIENMIIEKLNIKPKDVTVSTPLCDLYPEIYKIGCTVTESPLYHIKWAELKKALKKHKITKQFNEYFGQQTCLIEGPYPHDVEAVLVRIFKKKLVGTQLIMD